MKEAKIADGKTKEKEIEAGFHKQRDGKGDQVVNSSSMTNALSICTILLIILLYYEIMKIIVFFCLPDLELIIQLCFCRVIVIVPCDCTS